MTAIGQVEDAPPPFKRPRLSPARSHGQAFDKSLVMPTDMDQPGESAIGKVQEIDPCGPVNTADSFQERSQDTGVHYHELTDAEYLLRRMRRQVGTVQAEEQKSLIRETVSPL